MAKRWRVKPGRTIHRGPGDHLMPGQEFEADEELLEALGVRAYVEEIRQMPQRHDRQLKSPIDRQG